MPPIKFFFWGGGDSYVYWKLTVFTVCLMTSYAIWAISHWLQYSPHAPDHRMHRFTKRIWTTWNQIRIKMQSKIALSTKKYTKVSWMGITRSATSDLNYLEIQFQLMFNRMYLRWHVSHIGPVSTHQHSLAEQRQTGEQKSVERKLLPPLTAGSRRKQKSSVVECRIQAAIVLNNCYNRGRRAQQNWELIHVNQHSLKCSCSVHGYDTKHAPDSYT